MSANAAPALDAPRRASDKQGWPRTGAVVAVALLAAFLVWLLLIRDGGGSAPAAGAGPVAVSEDDLVALADEVGHPVYWAGPVDGAELEATRTQDGQIYVRYLTDGAEVGDETGAFLTVGTYPFPDVQATLEEKADEAGALVNETPDGNLVVTNRNEPTSVYIADPDQELQVEVYDPDPERAFTLATSGGIVAVE
jgi:hypothetical protein